MHLIDKLRTGDDLLQRIKRGDFRALWNELVDVVYWWREFQTRQLDNPQLLFPHPAVVDISNRTGQALSQFNVVQLGGSIVDPAIPTNLQEFQQSPNFAGIIPTSPPDLTRFAILLDPIPKPANGSPSYPIGRAAIAGVVPVLVNVLDVTHGFASPVGGATGGLISSSTPCGATILTKPSKTGTQWCQVSLNCCCGASNFLALPRGSSHMKGNCSQCPDIVNWCVPFSGFTWTGYGQTPGCCAFFNQTFNVNYMSPSSQCEWQVEGPWEDFPVSGTYLIFVDLAGSVITCTLIFGVYFAGPSEPYQRFDWVGTVPDGYDCVSPLTLNLTGTSGTVAFCATPPASITITPNGSCGGGSSPPPPGCCGSTANPATAAFSRSLAFLGSVSMPNVGTDAWDSGAISITSGGCTITNVSASCDSSGNYSLTITRSGGVASIYPLGLASCSPLHLTGDGESLCSGGGIFFVEVTG